MESLNKLIDSHGVRRELPPDLVGITDRFAQAMDDDFNTPRCLAVLFDAARAVNRVATEVGSSPDNIPSPDLLASVRQEIVQLSRQVLGLLNEEPQAFMEDLRRRNLLSLQEKASQDLSAGIEVLTPEQIEAKIRERAAARKNKEFARADDIRAWLTERKVHLKDGPEGTTWEIMD
jgi:cysteinyl-tRNA synthetase